MSNVLNSRGIPQWDFWQSNFEQLLNAYWFYCRMEPLEWICKLWFQIFPEKEGRRTHETITLPFRLSRQIFYRLSKQINVRGSTTELNLGLTSNYRYTVNICKPREIKTFNLRWNYRHQFAISKKNLQLYLKPKMLTKISSLPNIPIPPP